MKVSKIVLSSKREENAVLFEDGSKLEGIVSISARASADEAGLIRATIEVNVFANSVKHGADEIESTDLSSESRAYQNVSN